MGKEISDKILFDGKAKNLVEIEVKANPKRKYSVQEEHEPHGQHHNSKSAE